YNESRGADIDPTPIVGVIGLREDLDAPPPPAALGADDRILVLGETRSELGGSEWARLHGLHGGMAPTADLELPRRLHALVAELVVHRRVRGVHDCSEGGLAVALAEMAIAGSVGFSVELGDALACFSESASRVVVSVAAEGVDDVFERASRAHVPVTLL